MSRSQHNAELKRQHIIRVATKLFLDQGYTLTSMDMIAANSGVTKQTVYRYYPSKNELFSAVMQEIRQTSANDAYQFSTGTLEEELFNFGRQLLKFHLQPEALGIYRLMITEGAQNKDLFKSFQNSGPRHFQEPLNQYLDSLRLRLDKTEFASSMFINMVLTARNRMLLDQAYTLNDAEQAIHVQQVVAFFTQAVSSHQNTN